VFKRCEFLRREWLGIFGRVSGEITRAESAHYSGAPQWAKISRQRSAEMPGSSLIAGGADDRTPLPDALTG
jgi:hypothetical protein